MFKETKDPLTNKSKVHQTNKNKTKTPPSKVSINPNTLSKDELTLVKFIKSWFEEGAWDEDSGFDMLSEVDDLLDIEDEDGDNERSFTSTAQHSMKVLNSMLKKKKITTRKENAFMDVFTEEMTSNIDSVIESKENNTHFYDEDVMLWDAVKKQTNSTQETINFLKTIKETANNWNHSYSYPKPKS